MSVLVKVGGQYVAPASIKAKSLGVYVAASLAAKLAGAYQAAASAAFDPLSVPGLISWHRSDSNVGASAGKLLSWGNRVPGGPTAGPYVAGNAPGFVAAGGPKGAPFVSLNGTSTSNLLISQFRPGATADLTFFFVARYTAPSSDPQVLFEVTPTIDTNSGGLLVFSTSSGASRSLNLYASGDTGFSGASLSSAMSLNDWDTVHVAAYNSVSLLSVDGSLGSASGPSTANVQWNNASGLFIGSRNNSYFPAAVDLVDILIFNRKLSASETTSIRGYIASRYAGS